MRTAQEPIAITALNRFEFSNALRFTAFRKSATSRETLTAIAAFEADIKAENLQFMAVDWAAVIEEANQLSSLHTVTGGHRSFDILNVASAKILAAKIFLTFDLNQRKLAKAVKLEIGP